MFQWEELNQSHSFTVIWGGKGLFTCYQECQPILFWISTTKHALMLYFICVCFRYLMVQKAPQASVNRSHVFSSFFYKQLTRRDNANEDSTSTPWVFVSQHTQSSYIALMLIVTNGFCYTMIQQYIFYDGYVPSELRSEGISVWGHGPVM